MFPKATYYVQKTLLGGWPWPPMSVAKSSYHMEDFSCLKDSGQLELVDGDAEILPGLWVKETGGHSRGHQVVKLNYGSEKVVFPGRSNPHVSSSVPALHRGPRPVS